LSVVWGIGLVLEASARLTLADVLSTGTFIAISPFITATVIGGLFAFTVAYTKRTPLETAALMARIGQHDAVPSPGPDQTPAAGDPDPSPSSPPPT
jgi:hypothetical protein